MARNTRRHVSLKVGVSVVAAALALPVAGTAGAVAVPYAGNEVSAEEPAGTTPPPPPPTPPPEPEDTPTPAPSDTPGSTPPPDDTSPPDTPAPSTPDGTGESDDGTPEPDHDSGPDEDPDRTVTESLAEQRKEIDDITAALSPDTLEVPAELKPAVEQLTGVLREAQDPGTPPQTKDAVIASAKNIAAALEMISDSTVPPEVRKELTGIVKQATSVLEAAADPSVPPEEQATTFLVVQGLTSGLKVIADPETPPAVQEDVSNTLMRELDFPPQDDDGESTEAPRPTQQQTQARIGISNTVAALSKSDTSEKDRKGIAETADEASSSLQESGDPRVSEEDRERAQKELDKKMDQLEKQLEETAAAKGLPDGNLGAAAKVCTDSMFKFVPESELIEGLTDLAPTKWDAEGVKDYWKSEESGDKSLDVHAQLRNDKVDDSPFDVARLIPELAGFVPADELFRTVGTPGLHCLKAALDLDRQGVEAGTWTDKAEDLA